MKTNKYVSSDGIAYEIIADAVNSETGDKSVIYRALSGDKQILVCSKAWWDKQNFVSPEEYSRDKITRYSSSEEKIKLFLSVDPMCTLNAGKAKRVRAAILLSVLMNGIRPFA